MPRLIVNADDFGLTSGVNRAIVELHANGVLTSATLMARAGATEEAIQIARATPGLGVGCHVVLVDGEPMLPASVLPTLTDQTTARLHPKLGGFLKRLLTGKITPAEIEAEARTQILSLQNRGVQLSHIDTHKHTHMFPQVLRPVLRAAKSCGIHRVRNPFEPAWSLHATPGAPFTRRAEVTLLRTLQSGFHRTVAQEGFTSTKGAIGVLATGTLDYTAVASLVQALPAGIWELVTHPGYNDADLSRARTRLLASRETERAALSALKDARGVELITFAQLETASAMSL